MKNLILIIAVALFLGGCAVSEQPKNCYDAVKLEQKEFEKLKSADASLTSFKNEYAEMSSYIGFLNGFIADYTKYIHAASGASAAINYMPIPYAGQISSAANFGAKITVLSANASRAVTTLKMSSKEFEAKLAAYEKDADTQKLLAAQKYADQILKRDIDNAQESLGKLKEGAASLFAVSTAVSESYASAGELIGKASGFFKKDIKEKKPTDNRVLKDRNDGFDKKLIKMTADFENAKDAIKSANTIQALKNAL